ncbi:MAG: metallophosphoesterase, partial [Actinomycetota bacterium]
TQGTSPTVIGSSLQSSGLATTADGFFQGQIDEARIWNVARSQSQIQSTMNLEIPAAQNLIGRWGLNEGTGTSAADSSGSNVNGTLVGSPTWVAGAPFNPDSSPPAPPQNLVAIAGGGNVSLSWTANGEPDLAGYNVYRATSPGVPVSGTPLNGGSLVAAATFSDNSVVGGTDYYYVVTAVDTSANQSSASNEVLATPTAGDPVMVGAGDIADCGNTRDEATAELVNQIPGQVFNLGDNVYPDGTLTEFQNCYGPSWGQFLARTRPVSGNHEYNTANAAGYFAYFGAAAGSPSTGYYSYDVGDHWHVVVLNSECAQVGGCQAGSVQEQWLRGDLAANADKNVIAMWHKPLFSNNANNSFMQDIWQALYDYGADVVLNGHAHGYERFAPQTATGVLNTTYGVKEFIVGTGGESNQPCNGNQPNTEVKNCLVFGVMKLTLHPSSYDWQFIPSPGTTFTDSGTASVHGPPVNGPPVVDTVVVNPAAPTTNQTLTATVTSHDPDGQSVTLSYQWLKNGSPIAGATGSTLNLSVAGNGDRGDQLSVRVTASDGISSSAPVTSSAVTVQNSTPTATVSLSPTPPSTNQTLTATATRSDPDGDPITLTYVWKVNGAVVKTTAATASLTDTLDLSLAGNGDNGDVVSVELTPNDGTINGTLVSASTTVTIPVVSSLPDSTFQVNGRVNAILRVGNRVYLGGDFTQLLGHNGEIVPRQYLAAIDATTGAPVAWDPGADGVVNALAASPDGSTIYAGGTFRHVATLTRTRIAAIDASSGAVRAWNPSISAIVRGIVTSGNTVYVGGGFQFISGQPRSYLGAIDATSGAVAAWAPAANGTVQNMVRSADGRIFVVGTFTTMNGSASNYLAPLDPSSGALLPWAGHPGEASEGLAVSPTQLFVGVGNGAAGNQVVAFDLTTGAQQWIKTGDGDVVAVQYLDGVLYAGGHFDNMAGSPRGRLAAFDPGTGALRADWTPTVNTTVAIVTMATGTNRLYIGGAFTLVSGVGQQRFAQFSGAPAPNTPPVVDSVAIDQTSPGTNDVLSATVTSHDADGNAVTYTYQWTRNGVDIAGGNTPTLNLSGSGHGDRGDLIRVRVSASDGMATSNAVTSSPVTVVNTVPSATVSLDNHAPATGDTLTAT